MGLLAALVLLAPGARQEQWFIVTAHPATPFGTASGISFVVSPILRDIEDKPVQHFRPALRLSESAASFCNREACGGGFGSASIDGLH
jgi:hypothetical protein